MHRCQGHSSGCGESGTWQARLWVLCPGPWARPLWRNQEVPRIGWWWGARRDRVRQVPSCLCSDPPPTVVLVPWVEWVQAGGWWAVARDLGALIGFPQGRSSSVKWALVSHLLSLLFLLSTVCLSVFLFPSSLCLPPSSPLPSFPLAPASRQGLTI